MKHLIISGKDRVEVDGNTILEVFCDVCQTNVPVPFGDVMRRLSEVHTCYYCDHQGRDVNRYARYHVGGKDDVVERCCDNADACITRVELSKEAK